MNAHAKESPTSATAAASPTITVTWAATSNVASERLRIGKICKPEGKWPVTDGVTRLKYFFKRADYPSLEAFAADIERRIAEGVWTMITGTPRRDLDLDMLHARNGKNFIDAPTTLFVVDRDGMKPDEGQDLSTPEAFEKGVVADTIRRRLAMMGLPSLSKAKFVLIATASTGMKLNSLGEPANGCARYRIAFVMDTPVTLKECETFAARLNGDLKVYTPEHNLFAARPVLPEGVADPIKHPVAVYRGDNGCDNVDVAALRNELGLAPPEDPPEPVDGNPELPGPLPPGGSAGDAAWLFKMRQMRAPPDQQEPLLSNLIAATPNTCPQSGGMNKWIGVGKGIWGACGGEPWGFAIWAKWSAQWEGDDPEENEMEWAGFKKDDTNGIDYLVRWALSIGTPEALAAVAAIEAAKPVNDNGGPAPSLDPARGDLLIASWLTRKIPPRDYLLGHVICTTSRWFVFGETGVGKTLLIADMAGAMAKGEALLGWGARRPARVMYLDGEMPAETFKERMELVASRFGGSIPFYGYNRDHLGDGQMPPLNTEEGEKWLMREIEAVKPDLIVFDSIMCLLDGVMGEEESWTQAKHLVRRLTSKRIAQIWLHHTGHDASKGFGTKTREWEMDTVVRLNFADENRNTIALEFTKARLRTPATADEFKPLVISLEASGWTTSALARAGAGSRRSSEVARVKSAIVAVYNQHGVSRAGADGKIVQKINVNALRDEVRNRGWLDVKDTGGLTDAARKTFFSAKGDLLSGGLYIEEGDMFWKDEPISFPPVEPEVA
jgi:hypothetical protein